MTSKPTPPSESWPRPPRPAARSRFSAIGVLALAIEPDTCTEEAFCAAARVSATISFGDLEAMPLPEEDEEDEPPHALSSPDDSTSAAAAPARGVSRGAMRRGL